MSDTQLLYIISGIIVLALLVCSTVYLSARQNRAQAIALVEQFRANQPAMDTMENLAKQVVPVGIVFAAMALVLPTLPANTDDEKQFKAALADLFKNLSDGKPWTPPTGSVNSATWTPPVGATPVSRPMTAYIPTVPRAGTTNTNNYVYTETMKDGVLSASKTPLDNAPKAPETAQAMGG